MPHTTSNTKLRACIPTHTLSKEKKFNDYLKPTLRQIDKYFRPPAEIFLLVKFQTWISNSKLTSVKHKECFNQKKKKEIKRKCFFPDNKSMVLPYFYLRFVKAFYALSIYNIRLQVWELFFFFLIKIQTVFSVCNQNHNLSAILYLFLTVILVAIQEY